MARPRAEAHAAVLLIDSDESDRARVAGMLRREGYEVTDVGAAPMALAALARRPFDLILTEARLPGFTNHAVAAFRELVPHTPIVVSSRAPSVEQAVLCMKQGATEYLTPDASPAALPQVVARVLERPRAGAPDPGVSFADAAHRSDLAGRLLDVWAKSVPGSAHVVALARPLGVDLFPCPRARRLPAPLWRDVMERIGELDGPVEPFGEGELAAHGLSGALVVPLRARRLQVGAALALRSVDSTFSAAEVRRATELGERLGAALQPTLRVRDLEERIVELEQQRDQTVQTEKLALARKLVGGVAHEINNPLAFVRANLEALRDYTQTAVRLVRGERTRPEMPIDELVTEIEAILSESQDGLRRIGDLIKNFQLLSAPHVGARPEEVELTELVDRCIAAVTAASASAAGPPRPLRRMVRETHEELYAQVGQNDLLTGLGHVITYLLSCVHGGPVAELEPIRLRVAADGGRPCVFVFDPLLEIPESERASLFDPRLTVEEVRGQRRIRLDLDLAVAHQLLCRAGAQVALQPGPNTGLIFRVRF